MTLKEAVQALVKEMIMANARVGTAENVDANKGICDVKLGENLYLFNVRLKAVESDSKQGVTELPKEGAAVIAMMLEGVESQWAIVKCSEVQSWTVQTSSGSKIEVKDNEEVHLNGDKHKGLVILDEVKKNFDEVKKYCESLKTATSSAIKAVGESTAASGTAGQSAFDIAMSSSSINFSDMENKKVKHGS